MSVTPIKHQSEADQLGEARDLLANVSRRLHILRLATLAADEGNDGMWGDFCNDVFIVYEDISQDVNAALGLIDRGAS